MVLISAGCSAGEFRICYNWSCSETAPIELSDEQLRVVRGLFSEANNASAERLAISSALGGLAVFAAQQSPTGADRGGNWDDQNVNGRMDCIDHSTNTTTYLQLIQNQGWLKFHRARERVKRVRFAGISEHWAGRIDEIKTSESFAVDSWFFDSGHPAVIYPLNDWLSGKSPDG